MGGCFASKHVESPSSSKGYPVFLKRKPQRSPALLEVDKLFAECNAVLSEGATPEAERLARELVAKSRQSQAGPGEQARCVIALARSLVFSGSDQEIGDLLGEATALISRSQSADGARCDLAIAQAERLLVHERADGAVAVIEEALPMVARLRGAESGAMGNAFMLLGLGYSQMNRYVEAEAAINQAVEILTARRGPRHRTTLSARISLAIAFARNGKAAKARESLAELININKVAEFSYPLDQRMGELCQALGDHAAAARWFENAMAKIGTQSSGDRVPPLASVLARLGICYLKLGRHADAEANFREQLRIMHQRQPGDDRHIGMAINNIAVARREQGFLEEALMLQKEAVATQEKVGVEDPALVNTLKNLGIVEDRLGHRDEAAAAFLRAIHIGRAKLPSSHPHLQQALQCGQDLGYDLPEPS